MMNITEKIIQPKRSKTKPNISFKKLVIKKPKCGIEILPKFKNTTLFNVKKKTKKKHLYTITTKLNPGTFLIFYYCFGNIYVHTAFEVLIHAIS